MKSKVLIVDDNQEMLLSLKEGLEKFEDIFTVSIAGDGIIATDKLKREGFSIVVTDLKMPRMDGFSLLAHIMEDYPHIPVIIMTGFSTPEMKRLATEGGSVGYIEKPFIITDLANNIRSVLKNQSDGGVLNNVTTSMFLQLIEMEQKTCTVRLTNELTKKNGALFFRDGQLLDAILPGQNGAKAAHEIFSWDQVTLAIQNSCALKEDRIHEDLQSILLKAMQKKDESKDSVKSDLGLKDLEQNFEEAPIEAGQIGELKKRIEKSLGKKSGLDDIFVDDSWDEFVLQISKIGDLFEAGKTRIVYVSKGGTRDHILIPDKDVTVISISSTSHRDRLMQLLNDNL